MHVTGVFSSAGSQVTATDLLLIWSKWRGDDGVD